MGTRVYIVMYTENVRSPMGNPSSYEFIHSLYDNEAAAEEFVERMNVVTPDVRYYIHYESLALQSKAFEA